MFLRRCNPHLLGWWRRRKSQPVDAGKIQVAGDKHGHQFALRLVQSRRHVDRLLDRDRCRLIAGLAGAYFTLESVPSFEPLMTNGRGFISLAAVIFGNWSPFGAWAATLLFGAAQALQINAQSFGLPIPSQFVGMLPYLLTMIALTGLVAYFLFTQTVTNDPALAAKAANGAALAMRRGMYLTELGRMIYTTPLMWVLALAPLAFVFFLSFRVYKMSVAAAQASFWLFAAVMGAWQLLVRSPLDAPPEPAFLAEWVACGHPLREEGEPGLRMGCLLYTHPRPRDRTRSRMPSFA